MINHLRTYVKSGLICRYLQNKLICVIFIWKTAESLTRNIIYRQKTTLKKTYLHKCKKFVDFRKQLLSVIITLLQRGPKTWKQFSTLGLTFGRETGRQKQWLVCFEKVNLISVQTNRFRELKNVKYMYYEYQLFENSFKIQRQGFLIFSNILKWCFYKHPFWILLYFSRSYEKNYPKWSLFLPQPS
jgi:hypothetical protein